VSIPKVIKDYLLVTKPGIIFGNLISASAGFFLAAKGRIDLTVLLSSMIGISLVVASGCVFNNCIDRNLDRKMTRTRNRALVKGLISLRLAVSYASVLGIAGVSVLWAATNPLSVALVLTGFAIYVGVYSLYLKRNSLYGALIGSLAGAAPPLAGYCAVSNRLDMGALILLSIFSLWQMPHCYAISIVRFDDFAAAGIPVLPVKLGITAAKKHIVGYVWAFMVAALLLTFGGYTGYSYLAVATTLCLSWLYLAWSGYNTTDNRLWAKKLFVFSLLCIFMLSVMMSLDFTVPATSYTLPTGAPAVHPSPHESSPHPQGKPRTSELVIFTHYFIQAPPCSCSGTMLASTMKTEASILRWYKNRTPVKACH
jgi:heme o synthase